MYLSQQKVSDILNNAPSGLDKRKIVESLVAKGYKLEGLNEKPTGIKETGQDIAQVGSGIKQRINERIDKVQAIEAAGNAGQQGDFRSGTQMIGQGAGAVSDVIGEVVKGGIKAVLPQKAETALKTGVENVVGAVTKIEPVQNLLQKYEELKQTNPALARDIDSALGFASLATDIAGGGVAKQGATAGARTAKTVGGDIIETVAKKVDDITPNISTPDVFKPEAIMQRVARVTPTAQKKFLDTTKENIGEYLVKRGIYGNDEEIITSLYNRFNDSKKQADDAIAQLPGQYKPTQIKTALSELLKRERAISSPGAISKDYRTVADLVSKYKKDGLTMQEINEVKRLFERNVSLDYKKTPGTLATTIEKANTIDRNIRDWQMKKAKELGLENLDTINRETQAARLLADELYKQNVGSSANNALSLTDAVLVAGGDPTSIGMLLARKTFGSKGVQSAIAKKLAPKATIGKSEAKFGTPKPGLEAFNASLEKKGSQLLESRELQKSLSTVSTKTSKKASRLISEEKYQEALKNMSKQRMNSGIPLDQLPDALIVAGYHIENGVRSAVELGEKLAEQGYKFTKEQLDKLFNDANLSTEAKKYKSGSDFYELSGNRIQNMLRENGIRGKEQTTKYWEELVGSKTTDSYAMQHRPNEMGSGHNIDSIGNASDFYTNPEYYKYSDDGTYDESIRALFKIKDKPEATITVYRASPKNELNNGDWISLSKKYAMQESGTEGTRVHSFKVKAKDIQFAGDDINEFGYFPKDANKK